MRRSIGEMIALAKALCARAQRAGGEMTPGPMAEHKAPD